VYCCQSVRTDLQNDAVTANYIYATEPKTPENGAQAVPADASGSVK